MVSFVTRGHLGIQTFPVATYLFDRTLFYRMCANNYVCVRVAMIFLHSDGHDNTPS